MTRSRRMVPVFWVVVFALTLGTTAWGQPTEFDEASVFIEINAFDGDAGFQGIVDGAPWVMLRLKGPDGKGIMTTRAQRDLADQGLTEFAWESAEPQFSEQPLAVTLDRFPEGDYTFRARKTDRSKLESTATLSHVLPDGPCITGPGALLDECIDPDADLVVAFDAVTKRFAELGVYPPVVCPTSNQDLAPAAIEKYMVVVEFDDKELTVEVLPGECTPGCTARIPEAFLAPDLAGKVEILAVADNGNKTAHEAEFETGPSCLN